MINAHTATRSFRELKYDLQAALLALRDICPPEGEGVLGLVEVKWSDGSVDLVPTYALINNIVQKYFPSLMVGRASLIPTSRSVSFQGGKYIRKVFELLIRNLPLSAAVEEMGSTEDDLVFEHCVIEELVAESVVIPPEAQIVSLTVREHMSVDYCYAGHLLKVEGQLSTPSMYGPIMDFSKVVIDAPMKCMGMAADVSTVGEMPIYVSGPKFADVLKFSGMPRIRNSNIDSLSRLYQQNNAIVGVEIPYYQLESFTRVATGYMRTPDRALPTDLTSPLDADDPVVLTALYPKKQSTMLDNYKGMVIRMVAPILEEKNTIVRVRNIAPYTIRACNAWMFTRSLVQPVIQAATSTASNVGSYIVGAGIATAATEIYRGSIAPLSYVSLPPFSAVDFLFTYDFSGTSLCAYMLPMKGVVEDE